MVDRIDNGGFRWLAILRTVLALMLMLAGWALVLSWFPRTDYVWGIDGGRIPNWKYAVATLLFWPVSGPIWLGVLFQVLGGSLAVLFPKRHLVWALRGVSVPIGLLAAWDISACEPPRSPDLLGVLLPPVDQLGLGIFLIAAAAWMIPARSRRARLQEPKSSGET